MSNIRRSMMAASRGGVDWENQLKAYISATYIEDFYVPDNTAIWSYGLRGLRAGVIHLQAGVTTPRNYPFSGIGDPTYKLKRVIYNNINTSLITANSYLFVGTYFENGDLDNFLPQSRTILGTGDFQSVSMPFVILPARITSIGPANFTGTKPNGFYAICHPTTPPTLARDSDSFGTTAETWPIYVPDASVNAYKTAQYWSSRASRIFPLSEFPT